MKPDQVYKRYTREFTLAMGLYAVTLIASLSFLNRFDLPQPTRIIVAVLPALPTVIVFLSILRALRDSDELQQRVHLHAVVFAAVLTALLTFSYGFLEGVGFPKMPTMLVLPLMFGLWGLGLAIFWRRYQ